MPSAALQSMPGLCRMRNAVKCVQVVLEMGQLDMKCREMCPGGAGNGTAGHSCGDRSELVSLNCSLARYVLTWYAYSYDYGRKLDI